MGMLDGKVAIVTGGGRGVGRAHVLALAREGASVVVNDIGLELRDSAARRGLEAGPPRGEVAQSVVDDIIAAGGKAVADTTDVGAIDTAGQVVEHAIEVFGRVDILVNNAGTLHDATTFDLDDARFDAEFGSHVKGTMGTTTVAAKIMRDAGRGGRIINTISAVNGAGGFAVYQAATSAVLSFTLTAATELEPFGITVNAYQPFAVTRMSASQFFGPWGVDPHDQATIDHLGPDLNTPLVLFLASQLGADVTGRLFHIFPTAMNAEAGIQIFEEFLDRTEGVTSPNWTVDSLAAAMPKIIH